MAQAQKGKLIAAGVVVCLTALAGASPVFAARGNDSKRHRPILVAHNNHHRGNHRSYSSHRPVSFFGLSFNFGSPHVGAVVRVLPHGHTTFVVRGSTFHYYDRVYYAPCPTGYVVVQPPVVVAQPYGRAMPAGEPVVINVPNSNGSYTSITIVKSGEGYVGPQGEYYPDNPTVEQLRALYGK